MPVAYKVLPHIEVQHHEQEHAADGDHKKLHHPCIGLGRILALRVLEEERLCPHPECLYKQRDQQRQFVAGRVDTHLPQAALGGRYRRPPPQHDAVERFIDHAPKARHHQRQGVHHHFLPQRAAPF